MNKTDHFKVVAGWLPSQPQIGTCYIDRARGTEVFSFEYERSWISRYPDLFIDPDLQPMPGRQYTPKGKSCFGFLSDAAPDRWGRKLMERRETADARSENRSIRKLMESDYILGVHDGGRMGGLRFQKDDGAFLADRQTLAAPPITELRKLQSAVFSVENNLPEEDKWLHALVEPGSSLGGARPKANVINTDGSLWIAKFPSRHDNMNIGAWEMVAHDLAVLCGLNVPAAMLEHFSDYGDTFLVKRFDRLYKDHSLFRIHFSSAMNLLGETDGSSDQHSYLDLVGLIESLGDSVDKDLQQLWRRLVFSICISNTDDHLRNHGFLLSGSYWNLSPAYDLNPVPDQAWLSLAVDFDDPSRDLRHALDVADYFRLTSSQAENIAGQIQETIKKHWPLLADKYHIAKNEQSRMSPAFSECERILS